MANEYFYDHFHQDSSTRVGNWVDRASSKKIFDFTQIEPGQSVLEIGPGRGVFADICLERRIEYSAVEANRQMAESLRQRGADVVQAMVPPLPDLMKEFDAAVMINALEHMNSVEDALKITAQIREVLKPKGRFVICSPDYLNLRHNFFNCDFSHSYVTTRRRLEQLLVDSGFGRIRSCHLSGHVSGLLCFLLSALVSRLPFGFLNAAFPGSKLFYKLYKGQLTFSRKVLIVGEK